MAEKILGVPHFRKSHGIPCHEIAPVASRFVMLGLPWCHGQCQFQLNFGRAHIHLPHAAARTPAHRNYPLVMTNIAIENGDL